MLKAMHTYECLWLLINKTMSNRPKKTALLATEWLCNEMNELYNDTLNDPQLRKIRISVTKKLDTLNHQES